MNHMIRQGLHSRRGFLGLLGSAALAAGFPLQALAQNRKVIVLGAGLAGLRAALLLQQQGYEVQVLEARNRVGGRVFTLDDVPGHPEGGANTIGPNYGRVIHTADDLGVGLERPQPGGSSGLIIDGQVINREDWSQSPFNTLPDSLRSTTPDRLSGALLRPNPLQGSTDWRNSGFAEFDVSAAGFFRERGLDSSALQWLDVNNSYGNALQETSLLNLYRVGAGIARAISMGQPVSEISGGNSRLPQAMAAALRRAVLLENQVIGVEQGVDAVRVGCRNGAEYFADAVICTLPATTVREIRFEPGLPLANRQAFQSVVYHKVTQAHLLADEPYWQSTGGDSSWWTNGRLGRIFTRAEANQQGSYNITVWINGDACDAFDSMTEDQANAAILSEFQALVPGSAGKVRMGKLVRWANEPYSQGTWAVWRPGEIDSIPALLSEPQDRVFFAGEHTAISNSGMEGAMESADRVVLETLRRLL